MKLGEKIKELRRRDGRTQDALASEIGVTSQAVSRWEKGICCPDIEIIPSIANYFGVTVDYLLGREGRMAVMEQKALDIIDGNTVFNEQEKELLEAFRSTTEKGRFKIIQAVMNICDEIEKKSASSDTSVTDQ